MPGRLGFRFEPAPNTASRLLRVHCSGCFLKRNQGEKPKSPLGEDPSSAFPTLPTPCHPFFSPPFPKKKKQTNTKPTRAPVPRCHLSPGTADRASSWRCPEAPEAASASAAAAATRPSLCLRVGRRTVGGTGGRGGETQNRRPSPPLPPNGVVEPPKEKKEAPVREERMRFQRENRDFLSTETSRQQKKTPTRKGKRQTPCASNERQTETTGKNILQKRPPFLEPPTEVNLGTRSHETPGATRFP